MATDKPAERKADSAPEVVAPDSAIMRTVWQALHAGYAPLVNRIGVNHEPFSEVIRLSFAEEWPESGISPRGGVTLSGWTAYTVWLLLGQSDLVKKWDAHQRAEAEKAKAEDASGPE